MLGVSMLAACQQPHTRANAPVVKRHAEPLPAIQLLEVNEKPAWWSEATERADGQVVVCASGDGESLLGARRKAMEGAMKAFVAAAGALPRDPGVQVDSAKTEEGLYRAFVRLTAVVP
jgi:hypothetical protein